MLLRMLPEQIAAHWDRLEGPIASTLPPIAGEAPDKMNNVLESLLASGLQLWLSYTKTDKVEVSGLVVTQIIADTATKTLSLLIYSVYSENGTSDQEWAEGFMALRKYAKSKGCTRIVGYTNVPQILKRVEQFGGDASWSFISFNV